MDRAHCHVEGELAAPILPTSGLLPGNPTSGRILSILLKPWHFLVAAKGMKAAACADDRSLKASGSSDAEVTQRVNEALAVTATFDAAVGFSEYSKKRQF